MTRAGPRRWRLRSLWKALLSALLFCLSPHRTTGTSGWGGGCFGGQDVFATVRENSVLGELVLAEVVTDTDATAGVRWSLSGEDAAWFYLEGRNLRLNTSSERVLDREVQGQVLIAGLTCYVDSSFENEFRIMVEILNENDNSPVFVKSTTQPVTINELTAVDTVVFAVQAVDADGDTLLYTIDQSSPDAGYFKIELPNSGNVTLAKPLDYETKAQLSITVHASETNTREQLRASAAVTVDVADGDDQYPRFLPCAPLSSRDRGDGVCASPVYSANVTEGEKDVLLDFSPGPVCAVDGDRALSAPVRYSILSGADKGRFLMDEVTGEVRLARGVEDRLLTPTLRLLIVAYQMDDPRKYSVATVLVHVLAVNRFPPQFSREEYRGFVTQGDRPASLVITYGNAVLELHVHDRDFTDGINPRLHFSLRPTSDHAQFYRVTQAGLLIATANQLRPSQEHSLEVVAVDEETGDTVQASVTVEVLYEGQEVPQGPLAEKGRVTGCAVGGALTLCALVVCALGALLWVLLRLLRKTWRAEMDPADQSWVAQAKHPNVSLRWVQVASQRSPIPAWDETAPRDEEAALPGPPPPPGGPPHSAAPPPSAPPGNTQDPPAANASPSTGEGPADTSPAPAPSNPPTAALATPDPAPGTSNHRHGNSSAASDPS